MDSLWSSADVARFLNVGISSVKRWTDSGRLESIRTAGGHRRYEPRAVSRLAAELGVSAASLPSRAGLGISPARQRKQLLRAIVEGDTGAIRETVLALAAASDRAQRMDAVLGGALESSGDLWIAGKLSIDREHEASHAIASALAGASGPGPAAASASVLLAAPPAERHELPLAMLRVVLHAAGWPTEFLGGDVPWPVLSERVRRQRPRMVLLTSRSRDPFESSGCRQFLETARGAETLVCVGGRGPGGARGIRG